MSDQPSTPAVVPPIKGEQDPSPLVMQMMQREIAQLQALLTAELQAVRTEIITRIEGMDKALRKVEQYPTDLEMAISRVREFFQEKFESVEMRFVERDKRFALRDEANKELLTEQRSSSERAINKAESSMIRELETQTLALRDLKERMDRTEGKTEGAVKLWGTIVAVIMVVGVIVGIVTAFAVRMPVQVPVPISG